MYQKLKQTKLRTSSISSQEEKWTQEYDEPPPEKHQPPVPKIKKVPSQDRNNSPAPSINKKVPPSPAINKDVSSSPMRGNSSAPKPSDLQAALAARKIQYE